MNISMKLQVENCGNNLRRVVDKDDNAVSGLKGLFKWVNLVIRLFSFLNHTQPNYAR